jgi:tetraacyldisaccharide 4'-kinase
LPSRVIYLLYRVALLAAFPFILAYVAYRCAKNRVYLETLPERFGFLPDSYRQPAAGAIWLHAVSVGEIISSVQLVARLRATIPGGKVFVSVSTLAGRQIASQKLAGVADGIFYAPLDFVWVVRRVIRYLRPALVIVMETEIWPNLWRESKRSGAGLLVLNGRISDKAMPRYESWRWFFAPVLRLADRILAQTAISRDRYIALGAAPESVATGGNLKYDFDISRALPPEPVVQWVEQEQPGLLWVAASTMPPARDGDADEDDIVLDIFLRLMRDFPCLRLILVPRRPERFPSAAAALEKRGIPYARRSQLPATAPSRVLLLDSMGELAGVFRLADVVFVGGTLCERGGHNILEPAFLGKPVIIGPHMENFPEIAADFRTAGACIPVEGEVDLEDALRRTISSDTLRADLGKRAREQALMKTGATELAVNEAGKLYELSLPHPFPSAFLSGLAVLWRAGSRWKRRRDLAAVQTLSRPVISVGGISAGGVGKTPLTLRLGEILRASGVEPAFLTRGYRRVSREACTVVPPGGPATVDSTGDEAQLLVRSRLGPVGICPLRSAAGEALLKQFTPDLFLLDDGFQHARLARQIDLVLIDTLDPFAGFEVIPAGRLREPIEALSRATAFVLMRCEEGRTYEGILGILRKHNPLAPVFRVRLEPAGWVDAASGEPAGTPQGRGGAFCGLGNPASFWKSLDHLGLDTAFRIAFPDHHRYHPRDLKRLWGEAKRAGATVLWTTEKDAMNLPPDGPHLSIMALRVRAKFENEAGFTAWLANRIKR